MDLRKPSNVISSGDDLNNYTTVGVYRCENASIAKTLSNCPVSDPFKLIVEQLWFSKSTLKQTVITRNSMITRTLINSTWSSWDCFALNSDLAHIGNYTYDLENTTELTLEEKTATSVASLTLDAGTYVLHGHVGFNKIIAGRQIIGIGTSISTATGWTTNGAQCHYSAEAVSSTLAMDTSVILSITESTTYYLVAYSEGAVNVKNTKLECVQIG